MRVLAEDALGGGLSNNRGKGGGGGRSAGGRYLDKGKNQGAFSVFGPGYSMSSFLPFLTAQCPLCVCSFVCRSVVLGGEKKLPKLVSFFFSP